MKEIKIIQDDDGKITVETTGPEGSPVSNPVDSVDSALEEIKASLGGGGEMMKESEDIGPEEMSEEMPGEESVEPQSASKGMRMEDRMRKISKNRTGARPKEAADWSDYAGM